MSPSILVARRDTTECHLLLDKANRHGLITGATGTGKTVTLQTLAEGFSRHGVPVFMADVKGDLTGISQPGRIEGKLAQVLAERGLPAPQPSACPVTLWDVFGAQGHPVRATISDMGPLLLARMLDLNDTQTGVLNLVFKIADDQGLLLLDLKDLRAMLQHVGDHARQFTTEYGNVSAASIGAIQRALLALEQQGAERFFGEPMLDIADLMQTVDGRGVVNILAADRLLNAPRLYGTFLLWLLSELFEALPEVGDVDKPKLVFFFDEAHLLFEDAPKVLLERIELVVRLIRSKGVGVFFVTQNPLDVPDSILGQLGNRIQHALRAFTPRDQKAVQATAQTMRPRPGLDIERAITELGVGEALVSLLDDKGRPSPTERVWVLPPASRLGPVSAEERQQLLRQSLVAGVYEQAVDRESAYEQLRAAHGGGPAAPSGGGATGLAGMVGEVLLGRTGPRGGRTDGLVQAVVKTAVREIGANLGRQLVRGLLGGLVGGGGRRR
ncbi:MAG: DUF853 family protein [Tepidimonas sp.]|uniref:helicase HerA-like domain-containing protein n=1 Tax=Tepidimonas sp. TaxID=2002775 RepID=UPI00298F2B04|nr:helicase HerA-like domain-containing protein [Tepidimonas sp.]MDW8336297.1 DUF853 family protein [Tepidimonas sp.]